MNMPLRQFAQTYFPNYRFTPKQLEVMEAIYNGDERFLIPRRAGQTTAYQVIHEYLEYIKRMGV